MEDLCSLFIRQPRAQYTLDDLGPPHFALWRPGTATTAPRRLQFGRDDFIVQNARNENVHASYFYPTFTERTDAEGPPPKVPVFVYCHGSAASRLDAVVDCLGLLLRYQIGVVVLDFAGCGHSSGDYMSLGCREPGDIQAVLEYVTETYGHMIESYSLWGRSMGGVSAVRYAAMWTALPAEERAEMPPLKALVLDSPFSNLWKLAEYIVENFKSATPKVLLSGIAAIGLPLVRNGIMERVPDFDIKIFEAMTAAAACSDLDVFIFHGEEDDFVPPEQSYALYGAYGTLGGANNATAELRCGETEGKSQVQQLNGSLGGRGRPGSSSNSSNTRDGGNGRSPTASSVSSCASSTSSTPSTNEDITPTTGPSFSDDVPSEPSLTTSSASASSTSMIAGASSSSLASGSMINIPATTLTTAASISSSIDGMASPALSTASTNNAPHRVGLRARVAHGSSESLEAAVLAALRLHTSRRGPRGSALRSRRGLSLSALSMSPMTLDPAAPLPNTNTFSNSNSTAAASSSPTSSSSSTSSALGLPPPHFAHSFELGHPDFPARSETTTASGHKKIYLLIEGGHNDIRPPSLLDEISAFIFHHVLSPERRNDYETALSLIPRAVLEHCQREGGHNSKVFMCRKFKRMQDYDQERRAKAAQTQEQHAVHTSGSLSSSSSSSLSSSGGGVVDGGGGSGGGDALSPTSPMTLTMGTGGSGMSNGKGSHDMTTSTSPQYDGSSPLSSSSSIAAAAVAASGASPSSAGAGSVPAPNVRAKGGRRGRTSTPTAPGGGGGGGTGAAALVEPVSPFQQLQQTMQRHMSETRQASAYMLLSHDYYVLFVAHPTLGMTLMAPWSGVTIGHYLYTDLELFNYIPTDQLFYFATADSRDRMHAYHCEEAEKLSALVSRNLDELLRRASQGPRLSDNIKNAANALVRRAHAWGEDTTPEALADSLLNATKGMLRGTDHSPEEVQAIVDAAVCDSVEAVTGRRPTIKRISKAEADAARRQHRMCCVVGDGSANGEDDSICTIS